VDRSQRVRTYNVPENRSSDHRVGFKAYNLDQVIDGDLDAVITALTAADRAEKIAGPDED
jgi:peptide chain release factor 1